MMKRIFVAFIVLLLVAAVAIFAWRYLLPKGTTPTGTVNAPAGGGLPTAGATNAPATAPGTAAPAGATNAPATAPAAPQVSEEDQLRNTLTILSRDFAERYGSYSSESDFSNLEDLLTLMTDEYRDKTVALIAKYRSQPAAKTFTGVTTKALGVKPEDAIVKDAPVKVRVLTQRETTTGKDVVTGYQDLVLVLRYQDDVWKVDSASWVTP